MKRTPLKRLTPLKAKKPWRPERTRIAARSSKRAKFMKEERVPLTKEMLADDPWCELAVKIRRVDPSWASCARSAIGLHELLKRSQGGSLTDPENVLRACGPCNSYCEDNPDRAWAAGLVVRRGETLDDVRRRWM